MYTIIITERGKTFLPKAHTRLRNECFPVFIAVYRRRAADGWKVYRLTFEIYERTLPCCFATSERCDSYNVFEGIVFASHVRIVHITMRVFPRQTRPTRFLRPTSKHEPRVSTGATHVLRKSRRTTGGQRF